MGASSARQGRLRATTSSVAAGGASEVPPRARRLTRSCTMVCSDTGVTTRVRRTSRRVLAPAVRSPPERGGGRCSSTPSARCFARRGSREPGYPEGVTASPPRCLDPPRRSRGRQARSSSGLALRVDPPKGLRSERVGLAANASRVAPAASRRCRSSQPDGAVVVSGTRAMRAGPQCHHCRPAPQCTARPRAGAWGRFGAQRWPSVHRADGACCPWR